MLGAPAGSDSTIFSTRSGWSGAPPPPIAFMLDVSRCAQSGWSRSSRLIVGTPDTLVTRSRSISSSARPASHLRMNTIAPPTSVHGWRMQLLAVTWNIGVGARNTNGVGSVVPAAGAGGAGRSPAATAFASASCDTLVMKAMFMTLCTDPRWVSCAPFGNPVVPDV